MKLHTNFVTRILGGEDVEHTLTGATWFWLLVPMLATVVLSLITVKSERRE